MSKQYLMFIIIGIFCTTLSYASNRFLNTIYAAYITHNGKSYEIDYKATYNTHGAVLTNKQNERLYLGINCDAYSPKYGTGSWVQNNGGFIVQFKNLDMAFGRQEMTMLQKTSCLDQN